MDVSGKSGGRGLEERRGGDEMLTFPDVQVDEQGAESVAGEGVGVDFCGEAGG